MGRVAPKMYSVQGSFFESMGSFATHDRHRGLCEGYMVILLFAYLSANLYHSWWHMPTFVDKVLKFGINTVKID